MEGTGGEEGEGEWVNASKWRCRGDYGGSVRVTQREGCDNGSHFRIIYHV